MKLVYQVHLIVIGDVTMSKNGFALSFVVITLLFVGIGMASVGKIWSKIIQREKEEELLFRGDQIRKAIESYYYDSKNCRHPNMYPSSLEDLLKDKRCLSVQRHLRKLYKDPMTIDGEWELIPVTPEGEVKGSPFFGLEKGTGIRIKGVRSKSEKEPLKKSGFPDVYKNFEGKMRYKDWEFIFTPEQTREGVKK